MARALVCHGKDCRRSKGFEGLLECLGDDVERVGCQKVCKGPVVGLELDGRLEWFARLRKKRLWKALRTALRTGRVSSELEGRRRPKRSGRLRG